MARQKKQQIDVLGRDFEFYEGGYKQAWYLRGTRIADMSTDAIAWLDTNARAPSLKGLLVQRAMSDDEKAALTAEVDALAAELEAAVVAVQQSAGDIVKAGNAETLRGATGANSVAAANLQVLQKKYDLLTLGPEGVMAVQVTAQEKRKADAALQVEHDEAAKTYDEAVAAYRNAKTAVKEAEQAVSESPDSELCAAELTEVSQSLVDAGEAGEAAEERLAKAQQALAALADDA